MKNVHFFDNSRLSAYKTCPRLYYYKHVLGWTRSTTSTHLALVFGKCWHSALEYVWQNGKMPSDLLLEGSVDSFNTEWANNELPLDLSLEMQEQFSPRTPGIAHEMLYHYIHERGPMLIASTLIGNEQPFAVPMPFANNVWYVGRMDKVIETNSGSRLVLEHKTTAAYSIKHNFQPSYVESWNISPQIKGYEFAASLYFGKIDGVWVDAALVHKKIHDQFKFIPVMHTQLLVKEWLENTAIWCKEIIAEEQKLEGKETIEGTNAFPKNEESCYGKYGECPFLDICRFVAVPDPNNIPDGFEKNMWEPFNEQELTDLIAKAAKVKE